MNPRPSFLASSLFIGLLALLGVGAGHAEDQACRIGFDIGSSGIRVGSNTTGATASVDIDYFSDFWDDMKLDLSIEPTIQALLSLPNQAGLPNNCIAVAGGYSIWRLAMDHAGWSDTAKILENIHRRTGVAIYVIPQEVEGFYGYFAAREILGDNLHTPYILDIGGGSLQIASVDRGWGAALGQRAWQQRFCEMVKNQASDLCVPNPVGPDASDRSASVLEPQIVEARTILGSGLRMTAVSPAVTKVIHPIVQILAAKKLVNGAVDEHGFSLQALNEAIILLQEHNDDEILTLIDGCRWNGNQVCNTDFVEYFVTNMLLVKTLMDGLSIEYLEVGSARINNVPGLLADQRTFDFASHYDCYLMRLKEEGVDAYRSEITSCPH
jgi:hypothetical protein